MVLAEFLSKSNLSQVRINPYQEKPTIDGKPLERSEDETPYINYCYNLSDMLLPQLSTRKTSFSSLMSSVVTPLMFRPSW